VRADASGRAAVTVTAAFALRAHDRVVLALHVDGDTRDATREKLGKTVFAQLLASLPRPRRSLDDVEATSVSAGAPREGEGDARRAARARDHRREQHP
jgi:hypothetical protein